MCHGSALADAGPTSKLNQSLKEKSDCLPVIRISIELTETTEEKLRSNRLTSGVLFHRNLPANGVDIFCLHTWERTSAGSWCLLLVTVKIQSKPAWKFILEKPWKWSFFLRNTNNHRRDYFFKQNIKPLEKQPLPSVFSKKIESKAVIPTNHQLKSNI